MTVLAKHRLRDMSVFLSAVNSVRHLALVPEVQEALTVWSALSKNISWVLIGGLALSFYRKPRTTQDVDILLLNESHVPDHVDGFKKVRPHTFRENGTHVEVELVTPQLVGIPTNLASMVFEKSRKVDGIRVASLEGMVSLKLCGASDPKRKHGDLADIVAMLIQKGSPIDLSGWPVTASQKLLYEECLTAAF
jgi:hypothetical protein